MESLQTPPITWAKILQIAQNMHSVLICFCCCYVVSWSGEVTYVMMTHCWPFVMGIYRSPVSGFPSQRDSNADLWCFYDVSPRKQLNKYSSGRCSKTPWRLYGITVMLDQNPSGLLRWCWSNRMIALTHLPLDKMAAISQTKLSETFSWMTIFIFW